MAPTLLGLLAALVGAGAFLPPVSVPRLRFLRRLGIRRAGAVEQRKNLTLLTCLAAPRVRYLGDNATLFLRYLNATSPSPIPADAEVASEQLDAASAGAVVEALWRSRELIVHDKAAYRGDGTRRRRVQVPQEQRRVVAEVCLLYTSPSPRDGLLSRMPSSA